ncbi:MAG TPA: MerR family transcriptional regulator [Thermoanaerobacterales bacterium]|nr:MerR family transcriptional regulator [Thermoanaerobacterales bacterium]
MELRNCPVCGKLFVYNHINLCPECLKKDEEDFDRVREFINNNPMATIEEVSEGTGVSARKILEYLKAGRLMLQSNNANIVLKCEICEEPILTGRLCEKCSRKLRRNLIPEQRPMFVDKNMKGKLHLSKFSKDERRR